MKRVLLLAVVGLLVFASGASALTFTQAWVLTFNRAIWLCDNRNLGLYYCLHPNYPTAPACRGTGVNIAGFPEWICAGQFVQGSNVPQLLAPRICNFQDYRGPYGGLLGESVRCQAFGGIG